MRILMINGPNLNLLGERETAIYGHKTLKDIEREVIDYAKPLGIDVIPYQSNLEGIIIDLLHYAHHENMDGVILNAAAYTHYSYAIYDAIKAITPPVVEVHLSDPSTREEAFRHTSVIKEACVETFQGNHIDSYLAAVDFLEKHNV